MKVARGKACKGVGRKARSLATPKGLADAGNKAEARAARVGHRAARRTGAVPRLGGRGRRGV